ncbi:MAG: MoxR family ATPase [Betaproteobacteria bacterium]|nr:MoxR family ATPase [Betaproteobacteria bacterium]
MTATALTLDQATHAVANLRAEIGKAVVGQREVIDQTLMALMASGHVLIEGVPGLGKTLLARALALSLSLQYGRIQFTPDLMPSDITGHALLDPGSRELRVWRGPVFTNLLLADEINRAPAKTQSALLEVMQEYQATVENQTLALPRPFMVLATQNPVESEGTYPLPEAQVDRFLLKVKIDYPALEEEVALVKLTTHKQSGDQLPLAQVRPVLDAATVQGIQDLCAGLRVDERVLDYAVRIARGTRDWPGIALGCGSRGPIALIRAGRAAALLTGREFVTPDDIKSVALPALRHRIALSPDAQLEGREADELISSLIESIDAPRL